MNVKMGSSNENSNLLGSKPDTGTSLEQDEPQIHVSGIFIVLLEVALIMENSLPILVVITYLPSCARGVGDRLIAALSVTCILSALIPTPLGLASYFTGSWYGGSPTCSTYQVTSTWCNLSALALLSYICVNCHFAVSRLLHFRTKAHIVTHSCHQNQNVLCESSPNHNRQEPSTTHGADPDDYRAPDQSDSVRIANCGGGTTTQAPCNANGVQTDFPNGQIIPGTSVSFFEYSKLEFLTENSQEKNLSVRELGLVYDEHKVAKPAPCGELENISAEHCNQDQYIDSSPSVSKSGTSNSQQSSLGFQDTQSTGKYDTVHPSNSQENAFSNGGQRQNHSDMTRTANSLIYENSTFLYDTQMDHSGNKSNYNCEDVNFRNVIQNADLPAEPRLFRAKDYISIALFFLFSVTLTISSLPVVGFGPHHDPTSKLCRSWLVPTPTPQKERVFFIAFLTCVYLCMLIGCLAAGRVGYLVSKRVKQEKRRTTRLYHEEENVPDIRELSVLDDLKRHYSLSCLALCGILTWLPIAIMLTLQKSGVYISEATLVYSNIATSLPCLLNPLLYSLVLARYREGYKAILERCRRKKGPQKPHQLRNVQRCCEHNMCTDSTMISSSGGHQCVHGRPNPTFDSCSFDEDIMDDDEDDEDNNDFAEDFEQYCNNTKEAKNHLQSAGLSEKTPLQISNSITKHTKSFDIKPSLAHHNKRQWLLPTNNSQSNEDKECLLANEIFVKRESETKL